MKNHPISNVYPNPNGLRDNRVGTPPNEIGIDVLIAENNEINRLYIENVLNEFGLSFKTVENGLDAVTVYKGQQPRIILMDIAMPFCDGVEATTSIRRHEQDANLTAVPIIALSANAIPGLRERYLDAGMNDYLLKPYSIDQIFAKLEQWMLPRPDGAQPSLVPPKADMFSR